MNNYIIVFYLLHLLFCLIYYLLLARKEKLAMTLFPIVVFIPYIGFVGISLYFIAVRFSDRTEVLALDEIILPTQKMDFIGIDSIEKVNNTVPVEEALKINDVEVQREIVLDIAKRDPQKYLGTLKQALLSEDSEIAHYAATSITKLKRMLDKKQLIARKAYNEDSRDEVNRSEYIKALDDVIQSELSVENILNEFEKIIIDTLIDDLNVSNKGSRKHYALLIEHLNKCKMYDRAVEWVNKYQKAYPNEDEPLKLMLETGYNSHNETLFENAVQEIIYADFPIRKSTMDLVQYWRV